MKSKLLFIVKNEDVKQFSKLNFDTNEFEVFFFNPNLEFKFKKKNKFVLNFYRIEYTYEFKKKIVSNSFIKFHLLKELLNKLNFQREFITSICHIFYIILNMFEHIKLNIPENIEYNYFDKKWIKTIKKEEILSFLINELILKNFFLKIVNNENQKNNFITNCIINFYNSLVINKIKNKSVTLSTAANYGYPYIFNNLTNTNVVIQKVTKFSFLFCISKLIKRFIFKEKEKFNVIYQVPDKILYSHRDFSEILKQILSENQKDYLTFFNDIFNKVYEDIKKNLNINKEIIKKISPTNLIAHHARWMDTLVTVSNSEKLGIKIYLISHGSHCFNDDKYVNYDTNIHLNDMLISPFADFFMVQSPLAYKTLNYFKISKDKVKKIKPIMWGYQKFKPKNNKNNLFTILHASTTKFLPGRPFMYESAYEYINGLKKLIKIINKIENCKLIIRHRNTSEINVDCLKENLNLSERVSLKSHGNFVDDINDSDMLISYSSTTIEEAIHLRKPVLLFGGVDHYKHIGEQFNNNIHPNYRKLVYTNDGNLLEIIQNIKNNFHNKPLSKKELSNYVFDRKVMEHEKFFKEF